jgi:hypothetical protein
MKKSPRPFTFEVKRSRLTSRTPPTFQRYVVAPVGADVQNKQKAAGFTSVRASDPPPLRSEGRILPSLLREKVWVEEPVLPVPAPLEPIEPSPTAFGMVELPADRGDEELSRPKRAKRLARSPDDLPRSERWKRRLPRVAEVDRATQKIYVSLDFTILIHRRPNESVVGYVEVSHPDPMWGSWDDILTDWNRIIESDLAEAGVIAFAEETGIVYLTQKGRELTGMTKEELEYRLL